MNSTELRVTPSPPSLMKSLMAGFDAISNHAGLIFFSLILDVFLWLGPRMRITQLIQYYLQQPAALAENQSVELIERLQTSLQEFNLLSILRTFPVGIPSLIASRLPVDSPIDQILKLEVSSLPAVIGLWLVITVIGLVLGTFFFIVVSQAAVSNKISWKAALQQWPLASSRVLLLAFFWLVIVLIAFIPMSCVLSAFMFSGIGGEQAALFAFLIFGGVLVWLLVPLIFSPHGIFVKQNPAWVSVQESVRLTRLTLPSTSLLILAMVVISEGMDILWNIPSGESWLALIGIAGHAFITTSLLAASFIYYRDIDTWAKRIQQQMKLMSIS